MFLPRGLNWPGNELREENATVNNSGQVSRHQKELILNIRSSPWRGDWTYVFIKLTRLQRPRVTRDKISKVHVMNDRGSPVQSLKARGIAVFLSNLLQKHISSKLTGRISRRGESLLFWSSETLPSVASQWSMDPEGGGRQRTRPWQEESSRSMTLCAQLLESELVRHQLRDKSLVCPLAIHPC